MGNQNSRTRVENLFNTYTDIDIEQRIEENCENNGSNTNRVELGSGNNIDGGIHQNIDTQFSCRMSTTLDSLANANITNEQFNKMKTEMNQTGVNLFQNQTNSQNARNEINNFTDINQLQEVIKTCNNNKSYLNATIGGDNNTIRGGIHQNISNAVDCVFNTDALLETTASTSSTSRTDQTSDMKQEGINPLFFMGSIGSSAVVVIILAVLFFMMSGGGKNKKGNVGSIMSKNPKLMALKMAMKR